MASDLNLTLELNGFGSLVGSTDLSTAEDTFRIGLGAFDAMTTQLTYGTSSSQAKQYFHDERTLGATTSESLDLAGGLTSPLGETITFTTLKLLVIAIDSPDGSKTLRVGPQSVANAFIGPWGGAAHYINVTRWKVLVNEPVSGYTVTAGTGDLLVVNNQTAGSITYRILLAGETA